jgi:hypothetical protein
MTLATEADKTPASVSDGFQIAAHRAGFVREQQADADHRDAAAREEFPFNRGFEKQPGEDGVGDDQQRKNDRDHTRRQILFGAIDEIEVHHELGDADRGSEHLRARRKPERFAAESGKREHGGGGDGKTVSHRPAFRDRAQLIADDEPG